MLLPLLLPVALAAARPNLVLIVADDLGPLDLSLYGGANSTPHIDALAARGVTMEAAYSVSPICSPSRAGLLTGRYPQRFGATLITHTVYPRDPFTRAFARLFIQRDGFEVLPPQRPPSREEVARQGVPVTEVLLPELLRSAGYYTAMAGKWHLGVSPAQQPQARGFESTYAFLDAFSLYQDPSDEGVTNLRLPQFADKHQWRNGRNEANSIRRDGVVIDEERYLTDAIADELIADIQAHRDRPFFLYGAFNAPHTPYQVPTASLDPTQPDPERRVYEAMVRRLDDAVGRVARALEEAGVADDTLIVITSDNGPAAYTRVASAAPYNGGKLTHLEGGVRVPMVVVWPGHLPEGARYGQPVSLLDVVPTLCAAGGASLPSDRPIDGVDLSPYLRGEVVDPPHPALYWSAVGSHAIRQGDHKLMVDDVTQELALYDLIHDPYERRDLAPEQPARVAAMRAALLQWESQMGPPAWPPVMQYRYSDGQRSWVFPL